MGVLRYKSSEFWNRDGGRGKVAVYVASDIPAYYVQALDADFTWITTSDGYDTGDGVLGFYKYTGGGGFVLVPNTINGWVVTSAYEMFYYTSDVIQGVAFEADTLTDTNDMFYGCRATTLEVLYLKTPNVTTMRYMFRECKYITSLDLTGLDTKNVTSLQRLVASCSALTNLNVSNFNTSNVSDMSGFAQLCPITSIDLLSFTTESLTNCSSMFSYCTGLTTIDLSSFDMSDTSIFTSSMFGASGLTTGYARTQADADVFNATTYKPVALTFTVKP